MNCLDEDPILGDRLPGFQRSSIHHSTRADGTQLVTGVAGGAAARHGGAGTRVLLLALQYLQAG